MKWELKKLKEAKIALQLFFQRVKDFKLTKYLLARKERKLETEIGIKEALIERHEFQIEVDRAHATALESEIAILQKAIKELEANVNKVIKVYNLYIN